MYHEILPLCTHTQKEITFSNASLHPREQFYMHKDTWASVFIVWELKELTEYCQLLKKGSESALEVRRCTTKFSHLPHMRRRRSPVLMQEFIPVNSSICHKSTSASVFIVWELKELTEYCQLLKKGSESALEVRRCTTKFSHLAHMRRRRSPVPMQVYIPVNSSICIRTLPQVYSSCESWKSYQSNVSCLKRALKVLWKCADVPRNSLTLHTCAEGDHLLQCKFTSQWTVLYGM